MSGDSQKAASMTVPALVGTAEVAAMFGVTKQRISQLCERRDFPLPVARLAATQVWIKAEVEEYGRMYGYPRCRCGGAVMNPCPASHDGHDARPDPAFSAWSR